MLIGISYDDNIDKAMAAIKAVIEKDKRVMKDPAPMIAVAELADSSVNLTIRMWCAAGDYWSLKFDMTKAMKEALEKGGFSIPFPQSDVRIVDASSDDAGAAASKPEKAAAAATKKKSAD